MKDRRHFIRSSTLMGIGIGMHLTLPVTGTSRRNDDLLKLGIIGLDTSHSPAFTKYINDPDNKSMQDARVVAAYPYGSTRIESSAKRIPEYTKQFEAMNVPIVDSIGSLLEQVDGILLETNDGALHYDQAMQVIEAGIPLFIDKPVAATLVDTLRIYLAADQKNVPVFSASSLRYLEKAQKVRHENIIGKVTGAQTYSPEHLEPSHSDLFWYGIHGVEILYTLMNTGCQRVRRIMTGTTDMVIGEWEDERLGTFRGDLEGRQHYGGTAFGTEGVMEVGPFDGYGALVEKIVDFFRTGRSPVRQEETLELYTFMEAAVVSQQRRGDWVDLKEVYDQAEEQARK